MLVVQIKDMRTRLLGVKPYKEIALYCGMSTQSITSIINRRGNATTYTKKNLLERMKELENTLIKEGKL